MSSKYNLHTDSSPISNPNPKLQFCVFNYHKFHVCPQNNLHTDISPISHPQPQVTILQYTNWIYLEEHISVSLRWNCRTDSQRYRLESTLRNTGSNIHCLLFCFISIFASSSMLSNRPQCFSCNHLN